MATKAQAFIGRKVRHYIRDLGMEPKQAVRVAYEQARKKGYKVGRPTRKNVDTFTLGLIGPAVEKAAATAAAAPRARKKAGRRRRARRGNDPVAGLEQVLRGTKLGTRERRSAILEYLKGLPKGLAEEAYHGGLQVGILREGDRIDLQSRRKLFSNPELGPVIGAHALAVEYRGGEGKKKGSLWRHDFTRAGAKVIGLEDGSVLIKRGKKPLWRYFD